MEPDQTQDPFAQSAQQGETDLTTDDAAAAMGFATTLSSKFMLPQEEANPQEDGQDEMQTDEGVAQEDQTSAPSPEEMEQQKQEEHDAMKEEITKEVTKEVEGKMQKELDGLKKQIKDALDE